MIIVFVAEYFDNEQAIYERTWRKRRPSQSTHNSSNSQCQAQNGRSNFSTIDRQLQMFENILNQAESQLADHDELTLGHQGESNELHKSNPSLSEQNYQPNQSDFAHQTNNSNCSQLQYLKLIGRSDNLLCANNDKSKCNRKSERQNRTSECESTPNHNHFNQNGLCWTPLNDLSSESDFEDEFEYEEMLDQNVEQYEEPSVTELFLENLVDIDVEDFNFHQFKAEPPVPMPRHQKATAKPESHQLRNSISDTSPNANRPTLSPQSQSSTGKNSHRQLPSGPCFTLSNQLKTLLHNSNRLKSQNYFFY